VLTATALGALGVPALADAAEPLCRPPANGPFEYQATLDPLVSGFVLAPPAPGRPAPPPPASTGVGAANLAREVLGAQFAGVWLSGAVPGWVVGLAPGPLDPAAARAAILDRISAHYTPAETTHLAERLHLDPQPYGDADLRATRDAVEARLRGEASGTPWGAGVGCALSDARRVEVTLYQPTPPDQFQRVVALLAPFGDKVRVELSDRAAPMPIPMPLPGINLPLGAPPPPVTLGEHVRMPIVRRCVRGREIGIAARPTQPAVRALAVRAGGRTRTIAGRWLAKPLRVPLRGRRTTVVVTVHLADGRAGTKTVTYSRCR